jgi:hypothetical protein
MPVLTAIDLVILALLTIMYFSFSLGYCRGHKRGYHEGEIENLITLREKNLELGQCCLCGYKQDSNGLLPNNDISRKDDNLLTN